MNRDYGSRITDPRTHLKTLESRNFELFLMLINLARRVLFRFNPPIRLSWPVVGYVDGRPH